MTRPEPNKDADGNVWKNSKVKEQLVDDLISGLIPFDRNAMPPKKVYNLEDRREIFHQFPYEQFRTNLNELRKTHRQLFEFAKADLQALLRDRTLHPKKTIDKRGNLVWDGSEAQSLLRQHFKDSADANDANDADGEDQGADALYDSLPAYKLFSKSVFLDHVRQEKRRVLYIAGLKSKKNKN